MRTLAIEGFIRLCTDGWEQGWHERNGGNLSYRMSDDDVRDAGSLFSAGPVIALPKPIPEVAGAYFMVTGTGRFMRNVSIDPEHNFGIIRIDDKGTGYQILWGLVGGRPTSELPTHLLNHAVRSKATNGKCKVIYHAHPANITALTYCIPSDARILTRILWQSETECAVVFPEGIGIVPWMVPGGTEIAEATAKLIRVYPAVVWAFHGAFASGATFDEAFGLMHTIEKAAEIYLKAKSVGIVNTITDSDLRVLATAFGVTLNPSFLS
ncbi:MAG: rhamnulose-1-phosphate aldolase [Sphaerochaetaceae bacterium]